MRDRIIEMLGNGIPATNVAAALGCTDSYISQILSEDGVTQQIQEARAAKFSQYAEQDASLEGAEQKALNKVISQLPFVTKATEAARIYSILNGANRKTGAGAGQAAQPTTIVQLQLPAASVMQFTLTPNKQVVEVAGRSMATLPAKSMQEQLTARAANRLLSAPSPSLSVADLL